MSIIGMTASPEAFLAREAEMCYATLAHVTDYDVWHVSEDPVTVEMVIRTLNKNTTAAKDCIRKILIHPQISDCCECQSALKDAIITNPSVISTTMKEKYQLFIAKYQ